MFEFLLLLSFDNGNNDMLLSVFVDGSSNDLTPFTFSFTSSQILSSSSMRNERLLISFKILYKFLPQVSEIIFHETFRGITIALNTIFCCSESKKWWLCVQMR